MASKYLHVVTNSEVTCFRQCKAKHGFAYIDLLRPQLTPHPLNWGTLYHHGADAAWMAAWTWPEASIEARLAAALGAAPVSIGEKAAEHIAEIEGATYHGDVNKDELCQETEDAAKGASWSVAHYLHQARNDLAMVPIMVEGSYEVKIPTAGGKGGMLVAAGKTDLVLFDLQLGRIVVQDHKGTASDVHSIEKRLELDTQLVGYVCAVKALIDGLTSPSDLASLPTTAAAKLVLARHFAQLRGATVGSIGYNVVRRKMPSAPNLNLLKKNACITAEHFELLKAQETDGVARGEVSVAAIDTLPKMYSDALEAQIMGRSLPATEKQLALLERLRAKGDSFFAQIEYFKGADAIERWRKELWVEAKLMRQAEREPELRTRNPMACTLPSSPPCAYSLVCLNPGDPAALRSYRVAKSKHEELKDENSNDAAESQEEDEWR